MNAKVMLEYNGGMHCEATGADGKPIAIDSAANKGKPGVGLSPLDLLALAHGSCTAMMLDKAAGALGLDVRGMKVEVAHEYTMGPPMWLASAKITFHLPIRVNEDQKAKLLAGAVLCPVHTALRPDVRVNMEVVAAK